MIEFSVSDLNQHVTRRRLLALSAAALGTVVSCQPAPTTPSPTSGPVGSTTGSSPLPAATAPRPAPSGTLTLGMPQLPATLDPHAGVGPYSLVVFRHVFDSLTVIDATGR